MNYKIIVEPEAQLDIENSFFYYKNKVSLQVAKQFIKAVQASYKTLKTNPFYEVRTKNFRAFPLKKFPFLIFLKFLKAPKQSKLSQYLTRNKIN